MAFSRHPSAFDYSFHRPKKKSTITFERTIVTFEKKLFAQVDLIRVILTYDKIWFEKCSCWVWPASSAVHLIFHWCNCFLVTPIEWCWGIFFSQIEARTFECLWFIYLLSWNIDLISSLKLSNKIKKYCSFLKKTNRWNRWPRVNYNWLILCILGFSCKFAIFGYIGFYRKSYWSGKHIDQKWVESLLKALTMRE